VHDYRTLLHADTCAMLRGVECDACKAWRWEVTCSVTLWPRPPARILLTYLVLLHVVSFSTAAPCKLQTLLPSSTQFGMLWGRGEGLRRYWCWVCTGKWQN